MGNMGFDLPGASTYLTASASCSASAFLEQVVDSHRPN